MIDHTGVCREEHRQVKVEFSADFCREEEKLISLFVCFYFGDGGGSAAFVCPAEGQGLVPSTAPSSHKHLDLQLQEICSSSFLGLLHMYMGTPTHRDT